MKLKNIIKINFILLAMIFIMPIVHAENKDIEAKYNIIYNVELITSIFNNETKNLEIDNYEFEISTTMSDVEVIIIKADGNANDYAKRFTDSETNYYLTFYKNDEKISTSNINIKINNKSKVLNIYNNNGKILEKSDDKINLTGNDYFLVITDKLNIEESNYIITTEGKSIENISDLNITDTNNVKVYNSKNIEVSSDVNLGTNYKVVVTEDGKEKTYTIIVKGDTTGDAQINLNDVTRLYHYYKGIEDMEESYILAGDTSKNEIINLNDVTKLYHYYKKIIDSL